MSPQFMTAGAIRCSVCAIGFSSQLSGATWTYTVTAGPNYVAGSGVSELAVDGYKLYWADYNGMILTEAASVVKSGIAAQTSCCEAARYTFTVDGSSAPATADRFMVVPFKGAAYLKVGKVTGTLLSAAFSSPSAVTAQASAPVAAGSTSLALASIAGIVPGMKMQLSGGGNTESKTVISVTPSSRRLSRPGRRLQAGTVTLDSALTHAYAADVTIKAVVPPQGITTTTTTTVTGGITTTVTQGTTTTTTSVRLATTSGATKPSVAAALAIVILSSLLRR